MPNFLKNQKKVKDIFDYLEQVKSKKIKDSTLGFHLRSGFEIIGVLPDYLPGDMASTRYGVHLRWLNPTCKPIDKHGHIVLEHNSVRIVCVQYQLRKVASFEEFATIVEYYVDVAGAVENQIYVAMAGNVGNLPSEGT